MSDTIYGPAVCPRPCAECADGKHHWLEESIDPANTERVSEWMQDHPGVIPSEDDLLAHWCCKHCPAWRPLEEGDYNDGQESDCDACGTCDGSGTIITCCDDICVGGGHCIHGDGEEICPECGL